MSPIDSVLTVLRLARRQVTVIGLCCMTAILIGGLYAWTTPPVYTAESSMMIEKRRVKLFTEPPMLDDGLFDGAAMESQIQLLRSDRIAAAVVERLNLTAEPEFTEPAPGLLLRCRRLVERFRPGTFPSEDREPQSPEQARLVAMRVFQEQLEVYRMGSSFAIGIRFKASHPALAAAVANGTADAYIAEQRRAKAEASTDATAWMKERLNELRELSATADKAVIDYKLNNRIVTAKGQRLDDQTLSDLNVKIGAAQEQTASARARLDRINAVLADDARDPGLGATVTDALANTLLTSLRAKYLELSSRLSDWSVRFGAQHLAVVDLRRQLEDVRRSTLNELKRVAETYRSDFEITKQKQADLEAQLKQAIGESQSINAAQSSLQMLESAAQTYRTLYDNLLQRYSEAIQQQSFPLGEAQLLNEAIPPTSKSKPKTKLILLAAGVLGLMAGFGLGFLRELFERVFRTGDQVESVLQTECIAIVPAIPGGMRPPRQRDTSRPGGPLTTFAQSNGLYAESIRAIKSCLDLRKGGTQVVGITSALPSEGKSATAIELATLIAQVGGKVVIVDCDIRNPSLSRRVLAESKADLIDVAVKHRPLEEALWADPDTGVTVLPGCLGRPPMHSGEILALPSVTQIFDRLRSEFDYVIADLPPLLALVDVRASANFVDAYALAIAWGRTKVNVVEYGLKSVRVVRDNLLGVILTKVDLAGLRRYEGDRRRYPDGEIAARLDSNSLLARARRHQLEDELV